MNCDFTDQTYQKSSLALRPSVDLRHWCSRVENQSNLGSCTGAAVTGAYELILQKQHPEKYTDLSSLFVYYNARAIESDTEQDAGAYIRSAVKAACQFGLCSEQIWPYLTEEFAQVPPVACYQDATHRKIKNCYRLSNFADILDALNSDQPVMIGVALYSQFNDIVSTDPVVKIPESGQTPIGSHAVCIVGYDQERNQLIVKNSFGPDWGMQGYFLMPFDYAKTEITDSWVFDIDLIN